MNWRSTKLIAVSVVVAAAAVAALAGPASGEIEQVGNLQVSVNGDLSPRKLPRERRVPIAVTVGWKISTVDGTAPPQLKKLRIEINRNGILDTTGLPTCPYGKIQPASTSRAVKNCRPALVGRGRFSALVGLEGQEPYVASGEMVVFNSEKGGEPVLYGQIYSALPFANSFVITFEVDELKKGPYGTALTAILPRSLRDWGNLTEIQMRLSRKFAFQGKRRSFISAGCPTPEGVGITSFRLARTSFGFVGADPVSTVLTDTCRVRR